MKYKLVNDIFSFIVGIFLGSLCIPLIVLTAEIISPYLGAMYPRK